jgi:hypothetical protein
MKMEYVVVSYPANRDVRIDGQIAGKTNKTLRVERGHHIFDLGEPRDYEPESVEKNVRGTTSIKPLHIDDFHPTGGGA